MVAYLTPTRCYSVGEAYGRALAERLVELARPGATIIDNCPSVVWDRRNPAGTALNGVMPNRRRTDVKPAE